MKYKIQTLSAGGWADLKASDGHSPYVAVLYDSAAEALEEVDTFVNELEDEVHENYRIVLEDVPEEFDLY